MTPSPNPTPVPEPRTGQQIVRQIRGRLFEAAWRLDDREWLDPKVVSQILDDVEREAALAQPQAGAGLDAPEWHIGFAAEIDRERLARAIEAEDDRLPFLDAGIDSTATPRAVAEQIADAYERLAARCSAAGEAQEASDE